MKSKTMSELLHRVLLLLMLLTAFVDAPVEHCEAAHCRFIPCAHAGESRHESKHCPHRQHNCIHVVAADTLKISRETRPFVAIAPEQPRLCLPSRAPSLSPAMLKSRLGVYMADMRLPMLC